jgi:predicted metal-dependent phosphoesterase TrpH
MAKYVLFGHSGDPRSGQAGEARFGQAGDARPGQPCDARPGLAGFRKADLHLHSSFSHDVPDLPELSPRALYDKAVARGMDYFTLTDHDTMKGVRTLARELEREFGPVPPIPLIPGVELKVRDPLIGHTVHINVLDLNARQLRELGRRRRSMGAFLAYCRDQGLYHAYNHPFWFERREHPRLETILALIGEFPVVELNAGRIPEVNRRTARLAWRHGRHLVANSDSHTGQVGRAYTMAPGDTSAEFLGNVLRGTSHVVPDHLVFRGFMAEIMQVIDLVFADRPRSAFKRTLLKQAPAARAMARALLGTRQLMGARLFHGTIRVLMRALSHGPAYAYILSQRWMDLRVARAEASLRRLQRSSVLGAHAPYAARKAREAREPAFCDPVTAESRAPALRSA